MARKTDQQVLHQGVQDKLKNLFGEDDEPVIGRPDALAPDYVLRAYYPIITKEIIPLIMDNFRAYVDEYNIATGWENVDIFNHNQEVAHFLKNKATDVQKAYAGHFPKLNAKLDDREYNELADRENMAHGQIIAKRMIETIKYPTEQFFQNFIYVYSLQLLKYTAEFRRYKTVYKRPVQPVDINSHFITQLQRSESSSARSLAVCSRTVRNHRKRLVEAGVLVNRVFQGASKAVRYDINPQILVVFDTKTKRNVGAVKQELSLWKGKNFPDSNEVTRPFKEEYKEKDDAAQSLVDKESAEPTAFFVYRSTFYKDTLSKPQNSPEGAAAETVKVEKNLTEQLRELIIHPQELAENLALHEYDNYTPLPIRTLAAVVSDGRMTNAEFKELVVQDFFKTIAKIYRNKTVYPGNWKKAINRMMNEEFLSHLKDPQGHYHPLGKEAVLKRISELRWRIESARKWFNGKKWNPLYPYQYLDPTRTDSKEVGFAYTKKGWLKHLKYLENQPVAKVLEKQEATRRKARIGNSKKYDTAIAQFLKGRQTQQQLEDYVLKNLPPEYLRALPKEIQIRSAERTAKKVTPLKLDI